MPNDLATLRTLLGTQLRDTGHTIWTSAEKDSLLTQAASRLWPHIMKSVRATVALAAEQEEYTVPNVSLINRVDILTDNGKYSMSIPARAWEVWESDNPSVNSSLFINRGYAIQGRNVRVHGYVPYDLSANLPPDVLVPLILARARAEAYRRMGVDRVKFRQWATQNAQQNVTVNELIQFINEADREASVLEDANRVTPKPVPGIQG